MKYYGCINSCLIVITWLYVAREKNDKSIFLDFLMFALAVERKDAKHEIATRESRENAYLITNSSQSSS